MAPGHSPEFNSIIDLEQSPIQSAQILRATILYNLQMSRDM